MRNNINTQPDEVTAVNKPHVSAEKPEVMHMMDTESNVTRVGHSDKALF